MTRDSWRCTDSVVVPDVVGLVVTEARQVAHRAGLSLAHPDPDGPPLGALTWPEYVVTGQQPAPGAQLWRWDSLAVTWSVADRGGEAGVREPRRPLHPLDSFAGERDNPCDE